MAGRVVVFGGTGHFGRLLVKDLLRFAGGLEVIASARRPAPDLPCRFVGASLDDAPSLRAALQGARVAILTAGPFFSRSLVLLDECLAAGIHYVDLADDTGFIRRARERVRAFGPARSAVLSGCSTKPGLVVVVLAHARRLDPAIRSVAIYLLPSGRALGGAGILGDLLAKLGRPVEGLWIWTDRRKVTFPLSLGSPLVYLADVSGRDILQDAAGVRDVTLWIGTPEAVLGRLTEAAREFIHATGVNLIPFARPMGRVAKRLPGARTSGAVMIRVEAGRARTWTFAAREEADRIPVVPATEAAARLCAGTDARGWIPTEEFFTMDDLRGMMARRRISVIEEA